LDVRPARFGVAGQFFGPPPGRIDGMWTTLPDSLCDLGESPFWHPQERALYWLDIPGRAVLRTRGPIEAATVERWPLAQDPGCMAPARRGGLVIALRDGIYRAAEWGGALRPLALVDHDIRTMRFNDGKCDALGRFWAGSLNEAKDRANAALYCFNARTDTGAAPTLTQMANESTTGNGLAFSPDARTLYWADTAAHLVCAWDWDAEGNSLSHAGGERVGHVVGMVGQPHHLEEPAAVCPRRVPRHALTVLDGEGNVIHYGAPGKQGFGLHRTHLSLQLRSRM